MATVLQPASFKRFETPEGNEEGIVTSYDFLEFVDFVKVTWLNESSLITEIWAEIK